MASITEVVQRRIEFRLMDTLTDEQKDRLEAMLNQKDTQGSDLLKFIETSLPNFDDIAAEETAKYKKELIGAFKTS